MERLKKLEIEDYEEKTRREYENFLKDLGITESQAVIACRIITDIDTTDDSSKKDVRSENIIYKAALKVLNYRFDENKVTASDLAYLNKLRFLAYSVPAIWLMHTPSNSKHNFVIEATDFHFLAKGYYFVNDGNRENQEFSYKGLQLWKIADKNGHFCIQKMPVEDWKMFYSDIDRVIRKKPKQDPPIYINGIGKVSRKKVLQRFPTEVETSLRNGSLSEKELGKMYKLEMVRLESKCGNYPDTFQAFFSRIPNNLVETLTVPQLAQLTDSYMKCYDDAVQTTLITSSIERCRESRTHIMK